MKFHNSPVRVGLSALSQPILASPAAKPSSDNATSTARAGVPLVVRAALTQSGLYAEALDDRDPGLRALVIDALVFAWFAFWALLGCAWEGLKSWRVNVWFWLTTHVDCCMCRARLHRAPLHRKRALWDGGPKEDAVSHTYCAKCQVEWFWQMKACEERDLNRFEPLIDADNR